MRGREEVLPDVLMTFGALTSISFVSAGHQQEINGSCCVLRLNGC